MNFIHSIKFRFTLWYLVILSMLLVLLASGVYFTLSQVLHRNLDNSIRIRAEQLSKFRDIISIVAGGTFEEEIGEFISFYFYRNNQLTHISHKNYQIPIDQTLIDQAFSGKSTFSTIEDSQIGKLRIFAKHFTPENSNNRPENVSSPPDDRDRRPGKFNRPPDDQDRRPRRFSKPNNERDQKPGIFDRPPDGQRHKSERFSKPEIVDITKAVLIIARPTRDIETALERLLQILLMAIPLTLLFAGGGGVFLAKRAFMPVDQITETAREIEEKDLSRRINVKAKDELGRLASTLNLMIERLERAFNRQKQFTSDASHELRAPLAVIQAEATLALQKDRKADEYRKSMETISQETEHMAAVINQLLSLARADAGKEQIKLKTLNLTDFLQEICSDVEILCHEKGIELQLTVEDRMTISGDKKSLKRLLHNLLDNAIKYTPKDGSISIMVQSKGKMAVISIFDTGIGIPSNELSLIFERFYRVDKARSRSEKGSGLGLAICKHIVDIHGGAIEVDSQLNKGSTFHVRLPKLK